MFKLVSIRLVNGVYDEPDVHEKLVISEKGFDFTDLEKVLESTNVSCDHYEIANVEVRDIKFFEAIGMVSLEPIESPKTEVILRQEFSKYQKNVYNSHIFKTIEDFRFKLPKQTKILEEMEC